MHFGKFCRPLKGQSSDVRLALIRVKTLFLKNILSGGFSEMCLFDV